MGLPQGVSWVFEGYGVLLRGLIKGFSSSLYCILVILVIFVNYAFNLCILH